MQEIELKFLVPDYKVDSLMRQAKIKSSKVSQLVAHYFDTQEYSLANSGMALRIRQEDESWVQTLKSAGDGIATRGEQNNILDDNIMNKAKESDELLPDLTLYENSNFSKALKEIEDEEGDEVSLQRLYVTDIERTTRLIKKDGNVIEVAYDEGLVIHGADEQKQQKVHELELELLQGDLDFLFNIAKVWCKRYKLCISTVTKAERGGLLLKDKQFADATKSKLKKLNVSKKMSQPEFMRAVIQNCMIQILPNASAIAAGSQDGNHVHQLRVGLRRLRTIIKFCEDFSADLNPEWIPVIKQTFSLLGEYRDREILQLKTQPMLEELGGPFVDWSPEREALKVKPIDAVRANDFQITLLEIIQYTMSDPVQDQSKTNALAIESMTKILDKLYKKICKASSKFNELEIEKQHDVRKRLKSLRYLIEFISPMFKKKQVKPFLKYLEPAQEELGDYNDDLVGHEFYREKTKSDDKAWFAVGYFTADEKYNAYKCSNTLKKIKQAPKFW